MSIVFKRFEGKKYKILFCKSFPDVTCFVIYDCLEANDKFNIFFYTLSRAVEKNAHPKKKFLKKKSQNLLKETWFDESNYSMI